MLEVYDIAILGLFHIFEFFSKTAWQHMNCHQATHVSEPSFLGFLMNRLAVEGDPPGDVYAVAQFSLVCLVYQWCGRV